MQLWFHVLLLSAEAACPASFQDLMGGIDESLSAYERRDSEAFEKHHGNLLFDVACSNAILEPQEVVQLHILGALEAWAREDQVSTRRALSSAYAVLPELELLTEVSVADVSLDILSDKVRDKRSPVQSVDLPLVPWSLWLVDGQRGQIQVDQGRPVLLQLLDTREGWLETWYLPRGGLPPEFGGDFDPSHALPLWVENGSEPLRRTEDSGSEKSPEADRVRLDQRIRAVPRKLIEDTRLERIVVQALKPLKENRVRTWRAEKRSQRLVALSKRLAAKDEQYRDLRKGWLGWRIARLERRIARAGGAPSAD